MYTHTFSIILAWTIQRRVKKKCPLKIWACLDPKKIKVDEIRLLVVNAYFSMRDGRRR